MPQSGGPQRGAGAAARGAAAGLGGDAAGVAAVLFETTLAALPQGDLRLGAEIATLLAEPRPEPDPR